MSGNPTEAEIQAQWRATVDILETTRNFVDGTLAGAGGKFDVLMQLLEGEYTPAELTGFCNSVRSGLSGLVSNSIANGAITPLLYEYGRILAAHATLGYGSGYRSSAELFRAIYEWFVANGLTVKSRAITYDTSATTSGNGGGGAIIGNGAISRLTVDQNGFFLEACHVEKKTFRCRADQNSGTEKNAEVFEFVGTAETYDAVLRAASGSGESARTTLVSMHAGTGQGGSLLTNSSFSDYTSTATPKFSGWTEVANGAALSQDTTTVYRSFPGSQLDASLKMTGGTGTITISQVLADMRVRRLDPETPYFLRLMVNKGTGSGGTLVLRLGSKSVSVAVTSLSAGWNELMIPMTTDCWFKNFDQDAFSVQIEWNSTPAGNIYIDDVIFAPFYLVDGTWWAIRGNAATHTAWMLDDMLTFTDTGGAPATGKIQWWLFVAGYGCLPSNAVTISFADP